VHEYNKKKIAEEKAARLERTSAKLPSRPPTATKPAAKATGAEPSR
jgi:hypothetical protein